MIALLVVLGAAVGVAGGFPFVALLRSGQRSAKVSRVLATLALTLICFISILWLVARSMGAEVVYCAGALVLAFLATVTVAGLGTVRGA